MNFLAHIYLSGESQPIKIGNFISDWIKGKGYEAYPVEIQKGIILHRHIDSYTDHHPIVRKSIDRLKNKYHLYAGIVVDIFYDHFLALEWEKYSIEPLTKFVRSTYVLFLANYRLLPRPIQIILPKIILSNRFESYKKVEGVESALKIMANNKIIPNETNFAIDILRNEYTSFKDEFNQFFGEIITFVSDFGIEIRLPFIWKYPKQLINY